MFALIIIRFYCHYNPYKRKAGVSESEKDMTTEAEVRVKGHEVPTSRK